MKKMEEHFRQLKDLIPELLKSAEPDLSRGIEIVPQNTPVWVFAFGKVSRAMAAALEKELGDCIQDGILISNQDPSPDINRIQQFKASHPYPDLSCWSASLEVLQLAKEIPAGATVIVCISGGTSSLLCVPGGKLEVEEVAAAYKALLTSGAPINHMNIVRKHLSAIKGGQLAKQLAHTKLITLAISDVPGDDLEVIGSGPTVPDSSTFEDAFRISKYHTVWENFPVAVRSHILDGIEGNIPDTPKPGEADHLDHQCLVLSTAKILAEKCAKKLKNKGYNTWVAPEAYNKEARKVSKEMCGKAISVLSKDSPVKKPAALVFYGESTVHVSGNGKGGRNMELALASAISIEGQHAISMLSLATDGIDGPTDAAGAIVNSETTLKARKKGLSPESFLQDNDSYNFFDETGNLIKTGPTGRNLMDLQVVLIDKD